ncbi:MAG TPA: AAA family ATPase [Ktedonobacterales bacterium]|jgi:DNA-binding CsgD family transcriptional regulator
MAVNDNLLGREREQAELDVALAAVRTGSGGIVLLAGEAGVGKTRLIETCVARSGLLALNGEAVEPATPPYGPIVAALRSALRAVPDIVTQSGPLAPHLALLLPELGAPPPNTDYATLVEALRCLFLAVARTSPAVIVLDDLQWADNATLELLPALASACAHERLLILGAYRSDEMPRGHPLRRLRNDLRRARLLREIVIEPLDDETAIALAARILGYPLSPALATALAERAEGVPLFVEELCGALATPDRSRARHVSQTGAELVAEAQLTIPDTLRDALLLRLDGLPDGAARLLELAAVTGREFDLLAVEKLAGTLNGFDALFERGVLIEVAPGRAAFRHALTREAIYLDIPWTRRRALHRQVAAHLEQQGAPPQAIAEHWQQAKEPALARIAWLNAAQAASAIHAYRDAVVAAQRALDLWPDGDPESARRLDLLDQLGHCAQLCGMLPEAARAWREAAAGWRQLGDLRASAEAERKLANVCELQGHWEGALAAHVTAAEAFAASGLPAEAATERLAVAAHLRSAARFRSALDLLAIAAEEAASAERGDLQVRVMGLDGNVRARMGQTDEGLALVRRALALALEQNHAGAAAEIYQRLADSLEHAGDYAGAEDTYLTAFSFCQANAIPATGQLCIACLTVVLRQAGEVERAMTLCREVLASEHSSSHARAVAGGILGSVYVLRGRPRLAQPLLVESAALARRIELAAMELLAEWGLAQVAQLKGSYGAAMEHCHNILSRWERLEECHYVVPPLRWAATFFALTRTADGVRACANALARIASVSGQSEALSALAHALGECALLDGDARQAVQQFDRALDLLRDMSVPFCHGLTEWRAGVACIAAGQNDAGALHLTSAYRTARKVGARPLAQYVAQTLQALGAMDSGRRRRGEARFRSGDLTRRQREILQLVAQGQTTAEIARQLVLSPRTVEMHVGNILAALDSRSRAEAVRRAAELGLLENYSTPLAKIP